MENTLLAKVENTVYRYMFTIYTDTVQILIHVHTDFLFTVAFGSLLHSSRPFLYLDEANMRRKEVQRTTRMKYTKYMFRLIHPRLFLHFCGEILQRKET